MKYIERPYILYKYLSDSFPIQNGLKQGHALLPLLSSSASLCAIKGPGQPQGTKIKWGTSASGLR
jgi:hypothetical protein